MNKKKYTPQDIENLYRLYKQGREVIDQRSYFTIRAAASEFIAHKRDELEMQKIMQFAAAHKMTPQGMSHNMVVGTSQCDAQDLRHRMSNWFVQAAQNMRLGWGGGIAVASVALAVLLVTSPYKQMQYNEYYISEMLLDESVFINELLDAEQDWQFSFASKSREQYEAFRTGVMVAGLVNRAQPESTLAQNNLQNSMQSYLENSSVSQQEDWQNLLRKHSATEVARKIESHYSSGENQKILYEFGLWLQYHYLLGRIALKNQDATAFINQHHPQKALLVQAIKQLKLNELIGDSDTAVLQRLSVSLDQLSLDELRSINMQLLKIKTLLLNS